MFADLPLHQEKSKKRAKQKHNQKNGFWQNANLRKVFSLQIFKLRLSASLLGG